MIILKKRGGAYGSYLLQLIKRRTTQQEACEHTGMEKIPTRTSAMSCTHHAFESSVEVTHPTLRDVGARSKVLLIKRETLAFLIDPTQAICIEGV